MGEPVVSRRSELQERAGQAVRSRSGELLAMSHRIAEHPELGLQESRASRWLADAAAELPGAAVRCGAGGLPTAFLAEAGSGELVLTLCAEYDALPEVGHGCGHNVIAAAGLGAFIALAPLADELDATIRLVGTPAEENEGGKITLLDAGVFDGTHVAMMVHPGPVDEVSMNPYASGVISAKFIGREAHASLAPYQGVNALDALTVALTAIGLARQQLEPGQQIHGSIAERGGAPNVIPGSSAAVWMVRATSMESLDRVTEVVLRCIRAGALAAGCEVDIDAEREGRYANLRIDAELTEAYRRNAEALGRAPRPVGGYGGSTDMGNVSQRFPSIHPMIGLGDAELTLHTAEFAERASGAAGDAAVIDGAMLLARTAIDCAVEPSLRARLLSASPFG
jgi:amidohydrolase